MNEHKKECCFNHGKTSVAYMFFKFKSSKVNLLTLLTALSDKNGGLGEWRIMIGQIACQSNSQ